MSQERKLRENVITGIEASIATLSKKLGLPVKARLPSVEMSDKLSAGGIPP